MSYFRKSILLFVFIFGVFSAPYASAKDKCTSIQAHLTAVIAYCKGSTAPGDAFGGWSNSIAQGGNCSIDGKETVGSICSVVNPAVIRGGTYKFVTNLTSYGEYCPNGANGSPCECKKGTNWQTKTQMCVQSR